MPWSRRQFVCAATATAAEFAVARWIDSPVAAQEPDGITIHPRDAWGKDLPPVGPLHVEQPGDVRFLVMHHSASLNKYEPSSVPDQIRSFYRFPHRFPELA